MEGRSRVICESMYVQRCCTNLCSGSTVNLSKIIVIAASSVFLLYGVAFSLVPNFMSVVITGSEIQGASAIVDIRATYGGMNIAVGVLILYLYRLNQIRFSLIVIMTVLFCMALTRTMGFIVDGRGNNLMDFYLVLEIFGGLSAWLAMRWGRITLEK